MFGETVGISVALNSNSPSTSATAWKTATMPMNNGASSYLAGQTLGSPLTCTGSINTAFSIARSKCVG
jgi:hypothetical protein